MKKLIFATLPVLFIGLSSCAHKAERKLEDKISQEATVTDTSLSANTTKLIDSAPGLTDGQRSRLTVLRDETQKTVGSLEERSLKLRSILYKDLAAAKFNRKEVDLIKSRIKEVEKKKIGTLLDAVEKANLILGNEALQNEKNLNDFYFTLSHDPGYRM
jgi:hypothetical protein